MENQFERMESLIQSAGNNVPQIDSWGMYFYCDVNVPCGGGSGGFYWFDNESEMLELARYLCWMFPITEDDHDPILFRENGKIIDALVAKQFDLEKGKELINDLLEGSLQVSWWGEVKELISGESEFAKEMRSSFWDEQENGASDEENFHPISGDKVQDFLDWLAEYV